MTADVSRRTGGLDSRQQAAGTGQGWRVVAEQECRDLWLAGRGPVLLFGFGVLLSVVTYIAATNQGLTYLEQREAVNLTLRIAVAVGALVTLVVSADAISGERERGTLETLLLSPVSPRAVVLGKLVASLSAWLGAFLVSVPYLRLLSRGVSLEWEATILGLLVGTLVAVALAGLGVLISALSSSNTVSLSVSLLLLLALFAPSQLPRSLPQGWFGDLLDRLNPVGGALHYLTAVVVDGHGWTGDLSYLASPLCTAASPAASSASPVPGSSAGTEGFGMTRLCTLVGMTLILAAGGGAPASTAAPPSAAGMVEVMFEQRRHAAVLRDRVMFRSHVANLGPTPTSRLIAHLNVASLTSDVYVDPESWSSNRTLEVPPLPPGRTTSLSWEIQAVDVGRFAVYVVLLPGEPAAAGAEALLASPPVHVSVAGRRTLNAGGSLPVVVAVPVLLGLVTVVLRYRFRRGD
jgi:ABC-2 type transport system permease protein